MKSMRVATILAVSVLGLISALGWTPAFAQSNDPLSNASLETVWAEIKTRMEAGPIMLGSTEPIRVRLTGDACRTRTIKVGPSGPEDQIVLDWAALGAPTVLADGGQHVVVFGQSAWMAFPPFEQAQAERVARLFGRLTDICAQRPGNSGPAARDAYAELETEFAAAQSELAAVSATDFRDRRVSFDLRRETSLCHVNLMTVGAGDRGWLEDDYLYFAHELAASTVVLPDGGIELIVNTRSPGLGADSYHYPMDSRARSDRVAGKLLVMNRLCQELSAPRA